MQFNCGVFYFTNYFIINIVYGGVRNSNSPNSSGFIRKGMYKLYSIIALVGNKIC